MDLPSLPSIASALLLGAGAGLLSSVHCVAMCGPLVALSCGATQRSAWPWLVGRGGAYVGAGSLSAGLSGVVAGLAGGGMVGRGVSLVLAVALAWTGYRWMRRPSLVPLRARSQERPSGSVLDRLRRTPLSPFVLGALSAVLPCGALWSALAAAAATGHPLLGALVMLAFAIASSPALYLSGALSREPDPWMRRGIGVLLCLGAVVALARPLIASRDEPAACHSTAPMSRAGEVAVGSAP